MKYIRIMLCLLLAACTLLGCLTACDKGGQGQGTTAPTEVPTEAPTEAPAVRLTYSPDAEGMTDTVIVLPVDYDGSTVLLPDDPVREGYAFKGWYTEKNGEGDRVTISTAPDGDKTYYAKWTEAVDMTNRNHIRIGGFNGITEDVATESDFAALAACGVDEIYMTWFHHDDGDGRYSLEKSMQYMAWMEKYGIQCWYNDWELNELLKNHAPAEECMKLLSVYKDSPSYCGNYLQDEPAGDAFDTLIAAVTYFKELMPDYEMYINLLPNFAPAGAFVEGSFEKYIRAFVDRFPLSYVSQDFYPIDISGKKRNISTSYYASLYTEACAARDTGKEAWMYLYTMRDTVNAVKDYEPTICDVRFEAGNALAYGMNHLSYYCFDCPPSYARSTSFGMLKDHERTSLFDVGVQITKEIKALSEVFPRYLWQDVCYTGGGKIARTAGKTLPAAADALPFEVTTDGDLLIGIFDEANGDGCAYVFANNTDLNKQDQSVTVSFYIPEAQQLLAHIGTETVKLTAEGGTYTITLSCGQFCFLEVIR